MRDEMDGRLWNENHDQFSEWIATTAAGALASVRGSSLLAGRVPGQLLAALAAVSLTVITLGASAA
jgi:hypothetical protein